MTRIIEINRCMECPNYDSIHDIDNIGCYIPICTIFEPVREIPDTDTIPEFCTLKVV